MNQLDPLFVSEPELKWCESLINDVALDQGRTLSDSECRTVLRDTTNMCDRRIVKAVNLLRRFRRI